VRDGHRRGTDALAQLRLVGGRLDVDDDVALRQGTLHGVLDAVGGRVPLTDGGAGRDSDHDVGKRPARGLAEP